jgi:DNA mismatch repair protein MutS
LEKSLPKIKNAKVSIREWNEQVIFLHEVVYGKADKSYGIQVAKIAGVPLKVTEKATTILEQLEKNSAKNFYDSNNEKLAQTEKTLQNEKINIAFNLLEEIKNIDTDELTPKQALEILDQLSSKTRTIPN